MTIRGAAAWAAACFVLNHIILFVFEVLRTLGATDGVKPLALPTTGFISSLCLALGIGGVLRVYAPRQAVKKSLGWEPTRPAFMLVGVAMGLAVKWPLDFVQYGVNTLFPSGREPSGPSEDVLRVASGDPTAALVLLACLVAPAVEESFYRGALFGQLAKSSLLGAGLGSALLFVLAHTEIKSWPSVGIVALVLSFLRVHSGSSLPGIALHATYNGATLVDNFSGESFDGQSTAWGVVATATMTLIGLLMATRILGHNFRSKLVAAEDVL